MFSLISGGRFLLIDEGISEENEKVNKKEKVLMRERIFSENSIVLMVCWVFKEFEILLCGRLGNRYGKIISQRF